MPWADREKKNAYSREYKRRRLLEDHEWAERERARKRSVERPGARHARRAVAAAVARGELVRPAACECGAGGEIQAAHYDYTEPLRVRWLCRSCHAKWDKDEPKSHGRSSAKADELVLARRDAKRWWDRSSIVEAIVRWAALHGKPPRTRDWNPPPRGQNDAWPHLTTVQNHFDGSFSEAVAAAGFERPSMGRPPNAPFAAL